MGDTINPLSEKEMANLYEDSAFIHISDWADAGKYQTQVCVANIDGKNHGIRVTRSGSYFTDYDYSFFWMGEVEKKEKITYVWEKKNG